MLYAGLAKALPAAGRLVGLLENVETDWTVGLNTVGRGRDKITVESSHEDTMSYIKLYS